MVDLEAGSSRYANVKYLTEEEFGRWLKEEVKYWSDIFRGANMNGNKVHPFLHGVVDAYIESLKKIVARFSAVESLFHDAAYSDFVDANSTARLPMHDDKQAEEFRASFVGGLAMPVVYAYRSVSDALDEGYLKGYEKGVTASFEEYVKIIDKSIESVKEVSIEVSKDIKFQVDSASSKVSSLVEAATSAIALSEPVRFWEERRKIHKDNAKNYSKYAVISGGVFAILLFFSMLYGYAAGVTHTVFDYEITLPKTLAGVAVILLVTTGGIWATRIFVKLMMVNLTSEAESLERSTMIKTFVAMQALDSSISHESQLLFYTTLFRPSNNTISEESTAPEYGKILDAVLKSRGGDKPV
ncbi:DUF6161 domain-containing protein [Pseudomonas sp. Leaf434]|uniref:DUF6161 domain-containing protein n=1 Tax=Pseudomonas sp. Leaf434 TaxID=1736376 RepID=UPI0006F444BA|nr:DUF6161 domain-containing protein [Pseudomonas sp. Leaf434]KQT67897.1 hypothetical protein ASG55_08470 [Pseudomonas sp. Leaf434]